MHTSPIELDTTGVPPSIATFESYRCIDIYYSVDCSLIDIVMSLQFWKAIGQFCLSHKWFLSMAILLYLDITYCSLFFGDI